MSSAPWIAYEPLFDGVVPPVASTAESAGLDAVAYLEGREVLAYGKANVALPQNGPEILLFEGWRVAIPLGFKARLPEGFEMQVRTRSGLALKKGLVVLNSPGTIDSDYPGEWMVIVQNTSSETVTVTHGERIAQLVLAPVHRLEWRSGQVGQVSDRIGGFGSTGV